MNCPKCNSPINEGDKFCQVCGSIIDSQPDNQENVVSPQENVMPVTAQEPVINNYQQPTPNVNPNYGTQPVIDNTDMNSGMGTQKPKKGNTVIIMLVAIIIILLAGVVYLFISQNNDTKEEEKEDDVVTVDSEQKEVITVQYTESTINGYKFKLLDGYEVETYPASYGTDYDVVLYDDYMNMTGYVVAMEGSYDSISKEYAKAFFTSAGIENISYVEKTINDKKVLIYNGTYDYYTVDLIYVRYSPTKILVAEVYYVDNYDTMSEDIYNILTMVELNENSYSSMAKIDLPGIDLKKAIENEDE